MSTVHSAIADTFTKSELRVLTLGGVDAPPFFVYNCRSVDLLWKETNSN
jgi:hypothetical protein